MNTTYEIQVIHLGRDRWLAQLRKAVAAELLDVGLHRTVAVAVSNAQPTGAAPAIAAYLGSEEAASDPRVAASVDAALGAGVVVIPVVDDVEHFMRHMPPALGPANGFAWTGDGAARRLARILLAELGIEDRQRRVFISHKREDGLGAAEQVHDALSHAGFVPFIDRFVIRAGEPVQETIADALEDHAFLLLLETPLAHISDWVFDEVDYALSHTMGTLIVRWRDDVTPVPGSASLPRMDLQADEVVEDAHGYQVLSPPALDRVVAAVETAHAHGLVRRRRMLIRSIEEAAAAAGATDCVPLRGWRLLIEHRGTTTLLGVTPRLPTAEDLQMLDAARVETDGDAVVVLVHSARGLRPDRTAHLAWVTGDRNLELTPENAIGGRWQ